MFSKGPQNGGGERRGSGRGVLRIRTWPTHGQLCHFEDICILEGLHNMTFNASFLLKYLGCFKLCIYVYYKGMPRPNSHGSLRVLPNVQIAVADVPDRKVVRGCYNVDPVRERALWEMECSTR